MVTERMKTRYDIKSTRHEFQEGRKVWLWKPVPRNGLSPKLQSNRDGPFTVNDTVLNDVVVRMRKSFFSKPKVLKKIIIFILYF